MKRICLYVIFILLIILNACDSVKKIAIEVQEPAPLTLPVSARNVLILNNAIPQPNNHAVEQLFEGKSVANKYSFDLNSTVWLAVETLFDDLSESDFFDEVSVYKKPIREDGEWLTIQPLPEEIQDEFYETEGFDALITIDRLLFRLEENVKKLTGHNLEDPIFCDARVDAVISVSYYLRGKQSENTFSLSDSVFVKSGFPDTTVVFREVPDLMIQSASAVLGRQIASRFIPKWKQAERLIFTGLGARAKEAGSYAGAQKWDLAESVWLTELEKKDKILDKARLAANLALANEMQDKFEAALRWAEKAEEYYKMEDLTKYSNEKVFVKKYIDELHRRIQNNRLLNVQYGVDD
jgi:hypothetical protein